MNSNELADIQAFKTEELTIWERNTTATMLRQQQAEIEALKQIIDANNLNQNIGQFVKPTNEPVAYVDPIWMDRPDLVMSHQLEIGKLFARTQFKNYVPLYTHLADTIPYKDLHQMVKNVLAHPVKELTDEEIKFIAYPFESVYTTYEKQTDTDTVHTRFDKLGFARAILRKAQK